MNNELLSPLYKIKNEFFTKDRFSNLLQVSSLARHTNRSFKIINKNSSNADKLRTGYKSSNFNISQYCFNFTSRI